MQGKLSEQISSTDAEIILRRLPDWIQDALIARATEIDYPVEAIIEMAIASFFRHRGIKFCRL